MLARSRFFSFPLLRALLLLALVICAASVGCKGKGGRPKVAASIFPIYDLVRRVAGPDADVTLVLPPGKSAQGFEPGPAEAGALAQARLGVMVGLGLDGWMEKALTDAAPNARVLRVGDRVPTLTTDGDPTGPIDPNVWLDPQRARLVVKAIGEEMARIDSSHATAYRARANEVDASLEALDKEIETKAAGLKNKAIVTQRGSFGYFAERYKVTIAAVVEPAGVRPDPSRVQELVAKIGAKHLPIFVEPQLDPAQAKAIASRAQVPVGTLDPLGGSGEVDSYEKLLRYDLAQLEKTP